MRSSRAGSSCVTTVRLLIVALLWVAAHGTFAAERLYVVLGSYGQLESARARLERLSQSIPRSLAIARAQSDRGTLYRIVAGPLDRSAARAFMEHASEAGVKDAWTLPEGAVNAMVIVYQEEGTTPRVKRTRPKVRHIGPSGAPSRLPDAPASRRVPRLPD